MYFLIFKKRVIHVFLSALRAFLFFSNREHTSEKVISLLPKITLIIDYYSIMVEITILMFLAFYVIILYTETDLLNSIRI